MTIAVLALMVGLSVSAGVFLADHAAGRRGVWWYPLALAASISLIVIFFDRLGG